MPGGRPSLFTPENRQKLLDAVPNVLTIRQCAYLAGLSHFCVNNWLKKGKEDLKEEKDTEFARFYSVMREAQSKQVQRLIAKLDDGRKTWGAQAWLLERCFREDFGQDSAMIQEIKENHDKILELLEKKDA